VCPEPARMTSRDSAGGSGVRAQRMKALELELQGEQARGPTRRYGTHASIRLRLSCR